MSGSAPNVGRPARGQMRVRSAYGGARARQLCLGLVDTEDGHLFVGGDDEGGTGCMLKAGTSSQPPMNGRAVGATAVKVVV